MMSSCSRPDPPSTDLCTHSWLASTKSCTQHIYRPLHRRSSPRRTYLQDKSFLRTDMLYRNLLCTFLGRASNRFSWCKNHCTAHYISREYYKFNLCWNSCICPCWLCSQLFWGNICHIPSQSFAGKSHYSYLHQSSGILILDILSQIFCTIKGTFCSTPQRWCWWDYTFHDSFRNQRPN